MVVGSRTSSRGGQFYQDVWAALFRDALLTTFGEGCRKGLLKNACSLSVWTDSLIRRTVSLCGWKMKKSKNTKYKKNHYPVLHGMYVLFSTAQVITDHRDIAYCSGCCWTQSLQHWHSCTQWNPSFWWRFSNRSGRGLHFLLEGSPSRFPLHSRCWLFFSAIIDRIPCWHQWTFDVHAHSPNSGAICHYAQCILLSSPCILNMKRLVTLKHKQRKTSKAS